MNFFRFPLRKLHSPDVRWRLLFRAQLQSDDADEDEQGEEHTQQRGGVTETADTDDERADGADARPDDVRRAHGDALLRPIKEQSAQCHTDDGQGDVQPETLRMQSAQLEAERPANFKNRRDD